MVPGLSNIVFKSLGFYRKPVINQILIIALLAAVITGSLLTGSSVRSSLKRTASEHLGNAGIIISSGNRFFDSSLSARLRDSLKLNCAGLLELNGFCQNLTTQKEENNIHIYAVSDDYFSFQGSDSIQLHPGEAAVNEKLATSLGLSKGDELILRFNELSDIPSDAPFAPARNEGRSIVLKVGSILPPALSGNLALSISQMIPENVFLNISDIANNSDESYKINRLLIENKDHITRDYVHSVLRKTMRPSDIGISIIPVRKTGGFELRSDRIFLESTLLDEIRQYIPSSAPLITYLGNSISSGSSSTPYSFISALPASLYPETPQGNSIIINQWLADDLSLTQGDSLDISWYAPDSLNKLIEKKDKFYVSRIVDMQGIWADSLLMPAFPGISGSASCSDWDAGVPVSLSEIRKKDEAYWNKYRGTPKAFINYEKGIELWGNNFGPATAVRFPAELKEKEISGKLSGNLDPSKNGFIIKNLYEESLKAAGESVDFSTLFLSLGFFLILASFVLLSFAISTYLESRYNQIRTYFALGFRTSLIRKLLFAESGLISVTGCLLGSFAGFLVSTLIIRLLNTVWQGAVQTDTLKSFFSITAVLTGFFITVVMVLIFLTLKISHYLRRLNREKKLLHSSPSRRLNLILLATSLLVTVSMFLLSLILKEHETMFCFASGSLLLVFMILFWRQYFIRRPGQIRGKAGNTRILSRLYFSYYPSHAITPILFIATGIFAVFITGANRMSFDNSHLRPSGGTGGFLLWCENSIPLRSDLTTVSGRVAEGIEDEQLSEMKVIQMKRFAGDDASCLNLNHVTMPPILGIDPAMLISRGSFSFARSIKHKGIENPWQFLNSPSNGNTIFGIADQTVLDWGLRIKPGDTLIMRSENGQKLNIIIAAGLKSSVFQGYVLIGMDSFRKYFPSVAGSSVFLVDGSKELTNQYASTLNERFESYGLKVERTNDRLASFYEVTNTYLSVFGVFGALGMITGVAGLGFVLLRNYNYRKKEYALMMATGFKIAGIRRLIFSEQMFILSAGIISGVFSAALATLPSLRNSSGVPWIFLLAMVILIFITGTAVLLYSIRSITGSSLRARLKNE